MTVFCYLYLTDFVTYQRSMQSLNCRPYFVLGTVNKSFWRSVTIAASTRKDEVYKSARPWKEIPGPTTFPIIGAMHHFLPGGIFKNFNGLGLASKLYETYGPIVRLEGVVGRDPMLFLYDPEASAQILRGENWSPIRPGFDTLEFYRKNIRKDVKTEKPSGLLTERGKDWRDLRLIVNPMMLNPKTIKLYATALDEVAKDMVARIISLKDENDKIKTKFSEEMNLWSIESTGVITLGNRLGCFDPHLSGDSPIKKLIKCSHEEFKIIHKLDFSPTIWKFFPTANYKKAMALYEEHATITKHFIDQALKESMKKSNDEKSILDKLLEVDEDYAITMATDMLFAGIETTSNAMTSILYLLAVHPEKQEKLRAEVRSPDEKKTYLKACLKESMRLMPISISTRRLTTKEYDVLGYNIPANTFIFFGHQLMSMLEENYPRPNEFLPERWLVGENDPLYYKQAHPFAYSPFGFGARSCIARRIAELTMEVFLARMIDRFQLEWSGPPPTVKEILINFIMEPLHFIFKDAPK